MASHDQRELITVADSGAMAATEMLFEVSGGDKRAILTRLFAGENLPANRARFTGETVWLVDLQALPENVGGH